MDVNDQSAPKKKLMEEIERLREALKAANIELGELRYELNGPRR